MLQDLYAHGLIGGENSSSEPTGWVRLSDWLTVENINDDEEKMLILVG